MRHPWGPPAKDPARRLLNVTASAVLLVLAAPAFLSIAILVKFTSPGPVFYRQTRVGLDRRRVDGSPSHIPQRLSDLGGRVFTIWKFRTMMVDAEQATGVVWAAKDDPRVTRIGRTLRRYRLDELPQLWNVLAGDMNLVGPRPERPEIVARMRQEIPQYQQRHQVLPGITGHAQVSLPYDASLADVHLKVRHDLAYVTTASVWQDARIMGKTIPVMLFQRGAR